MKQTLKQAAIEGLISASKTFQDVKEKTRETYALTVSVLRALSALSTTVNHHNAAIARLENEIVHLKQINGIALSKLRENSLEISLPELSGTSGGGAGEGKPN